MYRYFEKDNNTNNCILSWKFKGLPDESIKSPSTPNNFLDPSLDYLGTKIKLKFSGSCLKQDKTIYNHGIIVNTYIVYEKNKNYHISRYPTLKNRLLGS